MQTQETQCQQPKKRRRAAHNRILCPLCTKPATAYHTRRILTYYKCKGLDGNLGCGHTFYVARDGD